MPWWGWVLLYLAVGLVAAFGIARTIRNQNKRG